MPHAHILPNTDSLDNSDGNAGKINELHEESLKFSSD